MRFHSKLLTVGAFTIALSASGLPAQAAQRADRKEDSRPAGRAQPRQGGGRGAQAQSDNRNDHGVRQDNSHRPDDNRGAYNYNHGAYNNRPVYVAPAPVRAYGPRYAVPRVYGPPVVVARSPYRHYYGSGGHLSVYFGLGSGWRYGSPYSGRVYGYVGPVGYGVPRYYGDVRLQVRPREAAVYVDGYYAGIVDDFDGVFQRLTLTTGPHEIEVEAPGFAPQQFNVLVDPSRTVDLHGDLFPG